MPKYFIARLKEGDRVYFSFVEKKGEKYKYSSYDKRKFLVVFFVLITR